MIVLLAEQVEAVRVLRDVCHELGVDMVVIGAIVYRAWIDDDTRATEDVDVAVALDRDELPLLTEKLVTRGWQQDRHREHRWFTPSDARVDLLPIGKNARQEKQLTWPLGGTTMNLVGFDHVFANAVDRELAPDLAVRILPLPVWALLKIVSYLDHPALRLKDFHDLGRLMRRYKEDSDRRFSDEVLNTGIDYEQAGAYLLGRDLARLCTELDEVAVVDRFLGQVFDSDRRMLLEQEDLFPQSTDHGELRLARDLAALARGFHETRALPPM
jgi:predicted nucleotidyltransferase